MLKSFYLHPGMLFAKKEPHYVTTVVGSCISVCLWDSKLQMGGINHFLLPLWNGEGLATPRYGNVAIRKLLERMLSLGCDRKRLGAKVFGGASMMGKPHPLLDIGGRNSRFAFDTLEEEGIPVLSYDVGGDRGRKIIYNTVTGIASVRRLGVLGSWLNRLDPILHQAVRNPE